MSSCEKCHEQTEKFYSEIVASKLERANFRQFIIILVLIIALIASNLGWIYYESQFEDSTTQTVEQRAENGENKFAGGDVVYGMAEDNNN